MSSIKSTIQLKCTLCLKELTRPLVEIDRLARERPEDGEPWLKENEIIAKHPNLELGKWLVHPKAATGVLMHDNLDRINGCCDLDGGDGPNQICAGCRSEVAVARLDCWQAHGIYFLEQAVSIKKSSDG